MASICFFSVFVSCRMIKASAPQTWYPIHSTCPWRWQMQPLLPKSSGLCWDRLCPDPAHPCPSHCKLLLSQIRPECSSPPWESNLATLWWLQDRRCVVGLHAKELEVSLLILYLLHFSVLIKAVRWFFWYFDPCQFLYFKEVKCSRIFPSLKSPKVMTWNGFMCTYSNNMLHITTEMMPAELALL